MGESKSSEAVQANPGCFILAAVAVVVVLVSQCDGNKSTEASAIPSEAGALPVEATTEPTGPPPVTEQAQSDLETGHRAFGKSLAVDDATAALVFSKNCYAALGDAFTWAKLDQCGSFDAAAAANVLSEELTGDQAELNYFDGEAAAQRFLSSGTSQGADADTMDARWEGIANFARRAADGAEKAREAAAARAAAERSPESSGDMDSDDETGNWEQTGE